MASQNNTSLSPTELLALDPNSGVNNLTNSDFNSTQAANQAAMNSVSTPIGDVGQALNFSGGYSTSQGQPTISSQDQARNELARLGQKAISAPQQQGAYTTYNQRLVDTSGRYPVQLIGADNEDLYAGAQSWASKMIHGLGKGLILAGTTAISGTVGLLDGIGESIYNRDFSKFSDNATNRLMNSINEDLENKLPNYYSTQERNASWYSPSRWATANFFWDKFVKNLGFVGGAMITGAGYSKAISMIPSIAKAWSVGGALEALSNSEKAAAIANSLGVDAETITNSLNTIKKGVDKFSSIYDVTSKAHRAVVATLGSIGESSLEAMNNANQYKQEQIQNYIDKYGVSPTGQQLQDIEDQAKGVNTSSFLLNMGLLSATNFVQFPRLLNSQAEQRALAEAAGGETNNIRRLADGTYEAVQPKSVFGKFFKGGYKVLVEPSEAFEEGAQNVIQVGTSDYYSKKNSKEGSDFFNSLYTGVQQTVGTNEGMEAILLGGLSGGLSQSGILNRVTGGKKGAPGTLGEIRERNVNTQNLVDSLNEPENSLSTTLKSYIQSLAESAKRGVKLSSDTFDALSSGDMQEAKDLQADQTINYLTPRVKYGRLSLVQEDIADMKKLSSTEEGLTQLKDAGIASQNDTRESFTNRLDSLSKFAQNYNTAYTNINQRFGNAKVFNKSTGEYEKAYSEDVIDKMAYAHAKIYDYDNRLSQMRNDALVNKLDIDEVINNALTDEGASQALDNYISSVNESDTISPIDRQDTIQKGVDAIELTRRRNHFINEFLDLKDNPSKHTEQTQVVSAPNQDTTITEESEVPQTVSIGDDEYAINTPYTSGVTSKLGADQTFTNNPNTITILGENEDGTVKAQDQDGNIKDYDKNELKSFNLFAGNNTTNSNFYTANQGAEYDLRMGNRSVRGRLEYNPQNDDLEFSYKDNSKMNKVPVNKDMFAGGENALLIPVNQQTQEQVDALQEYSNNSEVGLSNSIITKIGGLVNDFTSKINAIKEKISEKQSQLSKIEDDLNDLGKEVRASDNLKQSSKKVGKELGVLSTKAIRQSISISKKLISFRDQTQEDINALQDELNNLIYQRDFVSAMLTNAGNAQEFSDRVIKMYDNLDKMITDGNKKLSILSKMLDKIENTIKDAISFLRHQVFKFEQKYPKDSLAAGQLTLQQMKSNPNFLQDNLSYQADMDLLANVIDETEAVRIQPNEKRVADITNSIKELRDNIEEYQKELEVVGKVYDALNEIQFEIAEESKAIDNLQQIESKGPEDVSEQSQQSAQEQQEEEVIQQDGEDVPEDYNDVEPTDSEGGITPENPEGTILGKVKKVYEDTKKKVISRLFNSTTAPRNLNSDQKRHARFLNRISAVKTDGDNNRAIRVTRANQNALGLNGLIERQLGNIADPDNTNEGLILRVYVKNVNGDWWVVGENNEPIYKLPNWGGNPELQAQYEAARELPQTKDSNKELESFVDKPSEYFNGLGKETKESLVPIIDYIRDNNLMPQLAKAVYDGIPASKISTILGTEPITISPTQTETPQGLYNAYKKYAVGNTPSQQQIWNSNYGALNNIETAQDETVTPEEPTTEQTPQVDLSRVVYSVLPTTSLKFNENGDTRYSKATPAQAEEMSEKWSDERARTFGVQDGYVIEDYSVSDGTLNDDGVKKPITENFTTDDELKSQAVLKFNGKGIYVSVGSNTYYPSIRQFTNKELNNISSIFEKVAKDPKQLDNYIDYLQGIMYIKPVVEGEKVNPKQVYFDVKNGKLILGGNSIDFSNISGNKFKIQQFFIKIGINPRNRDIYDITTPYKEITKVNTNTPDEVATYPNYQSFLASPTQEIDGKILKRDPNTIPLYTTAVADRDNLYSNRYSFNETLARNEEPEIVNLAPISQPPLEDNDTPTIEDCN